jgi:hypothetical protein
MTAASPATPIPGEVARLGLGRTSRELAQRLLKGEHLVLWGPTGSGKTTLVAAIQRRLADGACALSTVTHSLDDITCTFERAFPNIPTQGISRRAARARLWNAADREPAVLLLDHVSLISTAMKGFLRRLRGGIAGVLLVFDVDSPRERACARSILDVCQFACPRCQAGRSVDSSQRTGLRASIRIRVRLSFAG